jgi:hypothetical protein
MNLCPSLIIVCCMYCKTEYGRKDGRGVSGVSHGVCPACLGLGLTGIGREK